MTIDRRKYDDDETVHHESARRRRVKDAGSMQLNLTAMIDVVFQLLIYFVVTASFALNEGLITAQLPPVGPTKSSPDLPPSRLEIVISSFGEARAGYAIEVQKHYRPASFAQLAEQLKTLQRNEQNPGGTFKPDDPVIIKPAPDVRWQHVVNAFNAAKVANYKTISFAGS